MHAEADIYPAAYSRPGVFRRLPLFSSSVLIVLILVAVFADFVAPFDPNETDLSRRLMPPVFQSGTWTHPLGTDDAGRDILSRLVFGARLSLMIALGSLLLGGIVGTVVGITAGFAGGRVDWALMRLVDLTIAYPVVLLALLLAAALGPSPVNVVLAISFVLWARFARVVRGDVLSIRERGYVKQARIAGAHPLRIAAFHIFPNVASSVIVVASLQVGSVIVAEASLSFLGAGVPPPAPAWGSMVSLGRDFLVTAWWLSTLPGIAISLTALSLNMLGDWLRDRLDPKLSQI